MGGETLMGEILRELLRPSWERQHFLEKTAYNLFDSKPAYIPSPPTLSLEIPCSILDIRFRGSSALPRFDLSGTSQMLLLKVGPPIKQEFYRQWLC